MAAGKKQKTWTEELATMLSKAASGIGEFQVQLALGKAEAKDEYEKLKKELRKTFSRQGALVVAGKAQLKQIQGIIEGLNVQLALGKAETADAFAVQKKKIVAELSKLDKSITALPKTDKIRNEIKNEIEVAKIKLDILRLHYHFAEISPEENLKKVSSIRERISRIQRHSELSEELSNVEREMLAAYAHMKKSFVL